MPMVNVTDIILDEEVQEMEKILNSNPKAKKAFVEFEAECKIRRKLATARKQKSVQD